MRNQNKKLTLEMAIERPDPIPSFQYLDDCESVHTGRRGMVIGGEYDWDRGEWKYLVSVGSKEVEAYERHICRPEQCGM